MITVRDFTHNISQYSLVKEPEYSNIIENLKRYHSLTDNATLKEKYQTLHDIVKSTEIFLKTYPTSSKKIDIEDLKNQALKEVLLFYKTYRNTPINKEAFTVASSSIFNENLESYFEFWKNLNPDYNFKLYYDSEAHASNIMLSFFRKQAGEQVIKKLKQNYENLYDFHNATFSNEVIKIIYIMKKEFSNFFRDKKNKELNISSKEIIKEFLIENYKYDSNLFDKQMNQYKEYFEKIGALDIRKNMLLYFNNYLDYTLYETELFVKLNSFDASNILKLNILDKIGGVYVDINYLPNIKKGVFGGIPVPPKIKKFSNDTIQQLKLIAIMKNKNYVKGFDKDDIHGINRYNEDLSDDTKSAMKAYLDKIQSPNEIFESIGDLSTSELAFLTDIKSNYENPVIAAHPNSIATKSILGQIRIRYKTLNEVYDKLVEENNSYDRFRLSLINEIQTTSNSELKEFLLNTRYYTENGLLDIDYRYQSSKHLNGYLILRGALKNILEFKDFNTIALKEVYNTKLYILFSLPKLEVTYLSEEALKRDKKVYYGSSEEYHKIARELDIEIKGHSISEAEPISTTSLTKLINDTERFIYEKDYVNIIFQLQNDAATYNTAKDIFVKYPENSILIQMEPFSDYMYYLNRDTMNVVRENISSNIPTNLKSFQKMKITIVGHGNINTVYKKSPSELMDYMRNHLNQLNNIFKEIKQVEISFFSCKNYNLSTNLEDRYPVRFLNHIKEEENNPIKNLVKSNIEAISISTSAYPIARIAGRLNIKPYSLFLNKEDATLRGVVSRYLIKYNENGELIVKPKEVKEALELRNLLDSSNNLSNISPQDISNSMLDELDILLDYEDISLYSIEDQDRSLFNSEIQEQLLKINDILLLTEELNEDITQIIEENNLSENYFPVLDIVEKVGEQFKIPFVDKNTGDKKVILTEKDSFEKYNNLSKDSIDIIKNNISKFSEENFSYEESNLDLLFHTSTLNAAFFIQSLIDYTKSRKDMENLNLAVQIQVYTQITSNSLGLITDASNIIKVVNYVIENPINIISNFISKLQFLGFLLDGINLGSTIYELVNSNEGFEKEVIAAKVGITAVNFSLNLASTIAYVTEASLTSEILGIAAVPVLGITIGLPSLINNILHIKYSAGEVMKFFEHLYYVKKDGYYTLNEDKSILIPNQLVPVKEIDLNKNIVKIGDMYISKTTGGSLTSSADASYPTYFSGPYPDNSGSGINFSEVIFDNIKQNDLSTPVLVLPSCPNVRYLVKHNYVIGSSQWSGKGEEILDTIKSHYGGETFHWRFYVTGGERIISDLYPNYERINVDIICDNKDRTFIAPLIENKLVADSLSYTIKYGENVNYNYVLAKYPINLEIRPLKNENKNSSKWFFKIDNLVYNTENIKDIRKAKLGNINSIISIARHNNKISLRIGNQKILIRDYTNEEIYLTFKYYQFYELNIQDEFDERRYTEYDIILRVNIEEFKIDKLIISTNVKYFILEKIKLLQELKNLDLPEEILEDVFIEFNTKLPLERQRPKGKGLYNLNKNEYILSVERDFGDGPVYTHIINDKTFSNDSDVMFDLYRNDSVMLKKYNKNLKLNEYFLQGFTIPKINGKDVSQSLDEKNKYLLQVLDNGNTIIKRLEFAKFIFTQFLYALEGMSLEYNTFDMMENIDSNTTDGKSKIITNIYNYISRGILADEVTLSAYPENLKLNYKFDDNLLISGQDLSGRKLNFVINKDNYYLSSGEWKTNIENTGISNHFTFNLLGKKELILISKSNDIKNDYILLSEYDTTSLQRYIDSLIIECNWNTNKILFKDFTHETKNNISSIDILLPTKSNGSSLTIYLPFKSENLKWDVDGSNLIIYTSMANKNKKITILDVFNKNNNKDVIINVGCEEPSYNRFDRKFDITNGNDMDLITFMKNIEQYSEN